MIDVLPTDWSPKNTNLYLASGANDVFPAPTPADGGRRVCADELLLFELIFLGWLCDIFINGSDGPPIWLFGYIWRIKDGLIFPPLMIITINRLIYYIRMWCGIYYISYYTVYTQLYTHLGSFITVSWWFECFIDHSAFHPSSTQPNRNGCCPPLPTSLHLFWIQMTVIKVIHEWKNYINNPDLRKHIRHFK